MVSLPGVKGGLLSQAGVWWHARTRPSAGVLSQPYSEVAGSREIKQELSQGASLFRKQPPCLTEVVWLFWTAPIVNL
jgi:hypothetical protein